MIVKKWKNKNKKTKESKSSHQYKRKNYIMQKPDIID